MHADTGLSSMILYKFQRDIDTALWSERKSPVPFSGRQLGLQFLHICVIRLKQQAIHTEQLETRRVCLGRDIGERRMDDHGQYWLQ